MDIATNLLDVAICHVSNISAALASRTGSALVVCRPRHSDRMDSVTRLGAASSSFTLW